MKKLFLLLAAGSIVMTVSAQERQVPIIQGPGGLSARAGAHQVNIAAVQNEIVTKHMVAAKAGASKTTTLSTDRWYDYSVYQNLNLKYQMTFGSGSEYLFGYGDVLWNDTFAIQYYTGGPAHITLTSMGTILQPQAAGFNNVALFDPIYGAGNYIKVGAQPYTVDSFIIPNDYFPGSKSTTVTDTLRVCFMYGNGGPASSSDIFSGVSTTGGHYGKISFLDCEWDSVTTTAISSSSSPTAIYVDILISATDTNSLNDNVRAYPIVQATGGGKGSIHYNGTAVAGSTPTSISVPVNDVVACAYTFISGDPATHGAGKLAAAPGDTLLGAVAPFDRYNNFRGIVNYWESAVDPSTFAGGSLPTPDYPTFDATDNNEGFFNTDYASGLMLGGGKYDYSPQWGWSSTGGGAYYWQYPEVSFHVVCPTCGAVPLNTPTVAKVNSVSAYPNPAMDAVNVSFSLTQASDVSVSLSNMMGQVVAAQKIANIASGKAVFNTSALPDGIYIYTLSANGNRTTGRVVLAH